LRSYAQGSGAISWKSFLLNLCFENKRVRKIFGSDTMYRNVAPHAWSPPNFPLSEQQAKYTPSSPAMQNPCHHRMRSGVHVILRIEAALHRNGSKSIPTKQRVAHYESQKTRRRERTIRGSPALGSNVGSIPIARPTNPDDSVDLTRLSSLNSTKIWPVLDGVWTVLDSIGR